MKKSIFFILFFVPFLSFSQELPEALPNDTNDRTHELWLNVTPVVYVIMGAGVPYQTGIDLMYKRRLNDKYWLRVGGLFSPEQNYFDQAGYDVIVGDSLLIRTHNEREGYDWGGFLGVEFRKKSGKLTRFIGVDMIYRQENKIRKVMEQTFIIDSISFLPDRHKYITMMEMPEELYYEKNTSMGGGVGFSAGVSYPLTNRFSLSAQVYMDFIISSGKRETIDRTTGDHNKYSDFTMIDFNQRLLQANILYRF